VQDAITAAGMVWHGMEIFPASTRPNVEECLRYAKEADILVGIIAWRYGRQPDGGEKSIAEMEYDAAGERLMFLLDRDLPLNPDKDFDPGPDRWKKQKKLAAFIDLIKIYMTSIIQLQRSRDLHPRFGIEISKTNELKMRSEVTSLTLFFALCLLCTAEQAKKGLQPSVF
jgi:hypothetical protein